MIMTKRILLCLLFAWHCVLLAQPLQLVAEKTYEINFFDYFLSSGQQDFYFSRDGSRIFLTSDLRFQVLDANNGELLNTGKHVSKANAGIASLFGILKNRSFNREDAIEKARFDEGTEYLALPEEGLVLILDWNVEENFVKAIDLETGALVWKTDRYRYSASSKSQYVDLFLSMAHAGRLQRSTPQEIATKTARLQGYGAQHAPANEASPAALGFFTPMSGTGLILLRVQDRYVALDLKTGVERWVYDQRKLNFGFAEMSADGALVVVNFNSSYFQAKERLILKLDPKTGQEIWTAEHLSDFREGRTYLIGDRLVCDYYGAEVFDLKTGKRLLLSIDERTVKTQNAMTAVFMSDASGGRGTEAIASPSVIQGDFLFTSTFKLGKRTYANDGSSKALIQKYDLRSGKQLWESKKLDAGTDLSYASAQQVFVRKGKAFGKSSIFVLDAQSGELLTETKTIDGFVYREGAADILTDAFLYRGGKKDIYAFAADSWELSQTYDAKSAKVGKLQAMVPAEHALMSIGDRGVAFFDGKGEAAAVIETPLLTGSFWNDRYGFLFSPQQTQVIDLKTQQVAAKLNVSPAETTQFLFSEDGSRLVVIRNGQQISIFANP
jgi:outer membrane protein assembly factor BamB